MLEVRHVRQHDGVLVTKIGLALSGGGFRAAIFHAGILLRLADEGLLESISGLSTVSGGSLGVSLIMSKAGMCWSNIAGQRVIMIGCQA